MPLLRHSTLALLLLLAPFAHADESKTDPRVKAVEEQLEADTKAAVAPTQKVKEAYLKAYQAECAARAKALEKAIGSCERKLKTAKEANAKDSATALEAKMDELKVELETWKANEGKKWEVALEEKKDEVGKEHSVKDQSKAEDIVGVWNTSGSNGPKVWKIRFNKDGTILEDTGNKGRWTYDPATKVWTGTWVNGSKFEMKKSEDGFSGEGLNFKEKLKFSK